MNDYCGFTDDSDMIACYDAYVLEGGELRIFEWMYYWLPEHGQTRQLPQFIICKPYQYEAALAILKAYVETGEGV